ncbi:hypothetical protein OnM2_022022 [Erysiphe neolycopersici]|uniref:Uncharacterized protein n=1 Tax=Erysiphe neolycopersici TaxID=212602 RepID=A0A420I2J2_9PEZI|nr:hypothetical protein OnM2_022022 [Erysiphe neolycopersici]
MSKDCELTTDEDQDSTSDGEMISLEEEISLNPFEMVGMWTQSSLSTVAVFFSSFYDTTHEMKKRKSPNTKYWKSSIEFAKGSYCSNTIRIDDVIIPYSPESEYGERHLYLCLPGTLTTLFKKAGSTYKINIQETKLKGKPGEWWKTTYDVGDVFQVIDSNLKSTPVSLIDVMNYTKKGVRANLRLEFFCRAVVEGPKNFDNNAEISILVKILSGFITSIGVDAERPVPCGSIKGKPLQKDTASDDIIKLLNRFKSKNQKETQNGPENSCLNGSDSEDHSQFPSDSQ